MNLGIITYNSTPYRTLQFNKFNKIKNIKLKIYYCTEINRKWEVENTNLNEKKLGKILSLKNGMYLNIGLINIIKENDILILGGYEQPTYILLSLLCRAFGKPYIIMFDGISCNKLFQNKKSFKYKIKNMVVKKSSAIFGNGKVSEKYFNLNFNKPVSKIYNQTLSVDIDRIFKNNNNKEYYKEYYRKKYNISSEKKVILYSGRLLAIKNVISIVKAISLLPNKDEYVLFITGGGVEEKNIKSLAKKLNVKTIITGFLSKQDELFKHYYIADIFMLMSVDEAWGLVVNEVMAAKMPIIISEICGCSLDLIQDGVNGYKVNPNNIEEIAKSIKKIFNNDLKAMGEKSFDIIKSWNVIESKKELERLLKEVNCKKEL